MTLLKKFLDRPYLSALLSLALALLMPFEQLNKTFILISSISLFTLIYTAVQKKWMKLLLYFFVFFGVFLIWIVVIFVKGEEGVTGSNVVIGDTGFYKDEIYENAQIKIIPTLKFLSKVDTIMYFGIEGEYDAECLYTGSKESISKLHEEISSNKEFRRISKLENYPTKIISKDNFNINELGSVYKKESVGRCIICIAFDMGYSKFYYAAKHY